MRIRRIKKVLKEEATIKKDVCVLAQTMKRPERVRTEVKAPSGFLGNIFNHLLSNPNLGFQVMVIIFTMVSEDVQMDRRIEGMTSTVEKIRNITDVLNNTMNSVKVAAETPKKIRQLLE